MLNKDGFERDIRALSDEEAVCALSVLLDERGLRGAAQRLSLEVDQAQGAIDIPVVSDADLARCALEYLADADRGTVQEAVDYALSPSERIDPVTISVTAIVLALLQTEVVVKRDVRGRWSLTVHKKAVRESALGRVLSALYSRIGGGRQLGD
ncbi:hypothetical protein [Nocardia sp. NPDC051570]|uniref:hypothetical protein n=1 Tax=Nocardia sp. NPDC051570 TaxID=3364324 RepID=UPI003791996C